MHLFTLARSSIHLSGVSNRLASSTVRCRFLGMVVGTAISNLIDNPDKRMIFGVEEMNSHEAMWYKSLTTVQDQLGSISSLQAATMDRMKRGNGVGKAKGPETPPSLKTRQAKEPMEPTSKIVRIEEIMSEDEDDGLLPHAKPDSDEEDEDEDPTLVQRNKPIAPVLVIKAYPL
jgi:telomere length regulation protein